MQARVNLSEKYMAGLLDADGFIGVRCRVGARPDLVVEITQRVQFADLCEAFAAEFGGYAFSKDDGRYHGVAMRSGDARKCLERLKGFMVVKRQLSKDLIGLVDAADVLRTADEVAAFRATTKQVKS